MFAFSTSKRCIISLKYQPPSVFANWAKLNLIHPISCAALLCLGHTQNFVSAGGCNSIATSVQFGKWAAMKLFRRATQLILRVAKASHPAWRLFSQNLINEL